MKYTLIVAALLGAITQQQLVEAVKLEHRHKHHHHAKHHQKNIGVRFVQSKDENASAADPDLVDAATPEADAAQVKEEAEAAATVVAKEKIAAADAAVEEVAKPAPVKSEEEKALTPQPETMQEYKDLKKEVQAEAKALKSEPADLPEEEQAEKEKKDVENLVDKADAERHVKQVALKSDEIANLQKADAARKRAAADPNDPRSRQEVAEAEMQEKKDDKMLSKLKKEVVAVTEEIVVDKQKAVVRATESAEEAKEKVVAEAAVAEKSAIVAAFEEKKVAADKKITEEFANQLPEWTPKSALLPENKNLGKAEKKIADMFAADEAAAAAKQAEVDAAKEEAGPNPAMAAIAAAEAEFDLQKENAASAAAAVVDAKVGVAKQAKKNIEREQNVSKNLKGESWVAAMPTHVQEATPYYPVNHKDEKTMKAEAA